MASRLINTHLICDASINANWFYFSRKNTNWTAFSHSAFLVINGALQHRAGFFSAVRSFIDTITCRAFVHFLIYQWRREIFPVQNASSCRLKSKVSFENSKYKLNRKTHRNSLATASVEYSSCTFCSTVRAANTEYSRDTAAQGKLSSCRSIVCRYIDISHMDLQSMSLLVLPTHFVRLNYNLKCKTKWFELVEVVF